MASRAELGASLPSNVLGAPGGLGARDRVLGDPHLASYVREIDEAETTNRGIPAPELPPSLFRLFDETGDRSRYEAPYFERRRRLVAAGLASWLWGGSERVASLEELIIAICDEYTWALPAHLEGSCLAPSGSVPNPEGLPCPHREYLDLFSCETAFALSEILALVGHAMRPCVSERAGREIEERVLGPFLDRPNPWRWELMVNNWCAVCAGSIGAAALYRIADPGRKAAVLARVLPSLERFLDSFSADGVCLEGLGYWTYGMGFFTAFADLLLEATDGRVDLFGQPKVGRMAAFQGAGYLNGASALSFADGTSRERYRRGLSAFLARRFPEAGRPPEGLAASFAHDHYGRWALSLRDLLWTGDESLDSPTLAPAPALRWFPDAQWLVCPQTVPGRLAFAAKGGHNDEPHNHNDLGSFELIADSSELLADLGCGAYTRDYFGEGRYGIFCNSSLGHSLPIVDGIGQSQGAERKARDVLCRLEGKTAFLSMDIAAAYDCPNLERLVRSFEYDGGSRLVLRDEFVFSSGGHRIVERFVTRDIDGLSWGVEKAAEGDGAQAAAGAAHPSIVISSPGRGPDILPHRHIEHSGEEVVIMSLDYGFQAVDRILTISFLFTLAAAG